mmetsp:Transcript_47229/g.117892  ORF Transcript_47229/g.117892 Transcript_47229/m.117892 type:complete len:228 (-) Transcript_47229:106-789(-)
MQHEQIEGQHEGKHAEQGDPGHRAIARVEGNERQRVLVAENVVVRQVDAERFEHLPHAHRPAAAAAGGPTAAAGMATRLRQLPIGVAHHRIRASNQWLLGFCRCWWGCCCWWWCWWCWWCGRRGGGFATPLRVSSAELPPWGFVAKVVGVEGRGEGRLGEQRQRIGREGEGRRPTTTTTGRDLFGVISLRPCVFLLHGHGRAGPADQQEHENGQQRQGRRPCTVMAV